MNIKKAATIGVLATMGLWALESEAKSNLIVQQTQKDIYEIVNDSTNIVDETHETIIHMPVEKILDLYWIEKWLLVINEHLLIEINNIRERYKKPLLSKVDLKLKSFSQQHAKFMSWEKKLYHMKWDDILRKRLKRDNFEFLTSGENLARRQETIDEAISDRMGSKSHKANILKDTYNKIGLWYYNKTWVLHFMN